MLDNIRNRIAIALLPKKKGDGTILNPYNVLSPQYRGIPIYSEMTVRKAVREGYKISPAVYRAVRVIIQAASAIPWIVIDSNGEPIKNHPFVKVMRNPNREFSGQDLMEFLIAHLELVGNALWQPIIVNNQIREIWPVMPDLVKPIPGGDWLKGWEVTSSDGKQHIAPPEQFVHFMQVDPGNPYWGMGPLMASARTVDTDNEAQDTQKITMQNRGVTDGVFVHETVMNQEQFEEARRQIRENFLAKTRRREPWVLGAGTKWQQMSLTAIEMDYIASRLQNKRDIAGAFGISPIFLGDLSQSSYDNMVQARKSLYEDVVVPLLDDIKATLNLRIAPMYGDITITYDISGVVALREDYGKKVEQAKTLWAMGVPFVEINSRLEMGFTEFPGWDRGYLPLNLLPTAGSSQLSQFKMKMLGQLMGLPMEQLDYNPLQITTIDLDTEESKTAHWKRIDRRRVAWWEVVSKKIKPLYDDELKAIVKAIRGKKPFELDDIVNTAINDRSPEWETMMTAIMTALIEDFGNEIAEDLGAEKAYKWTFDPFSAAVTAWVVSNGAASVKTILSTNLVDVKKVILDGMNNNLSTPKIASSLRQYYSDHSAFKAMRVARTEVCKASSFGNLEAARQSGVAQTKTWLTSRDDRVRDEHMAMDGETVGLNDIFSNGLEYPSEPMCRCVLTFKR